jgi:hypothetical protein
MVHALGSKQATRVCKPTRGMCQSVLLLQLQLCVCCPHHLAAAAPAVACTVGYRTLPWPTLQVPGPGERGAASCVRYAGEWVGHFGSQHVQQERPQAARDPVVGHAKAQAAAEVIRLQYKRKSHHHFNLQSLQELHKACNAALRCTNCSCLLAATLVYWLPLARGAMLTIRNLSATAAARCYGAAFRLITSAALATRWCSGELQPAWACRLCCRMA